MEAACTPKMLLIIYKMDGVITQNIKNQLTTVTTVLSSCIAVCRGRYFPSPSFYCDSAQCLSLEHCVGC
jgi:hypothetical protein